MARVQAAHASKVTTEEAHSTAGGYLKNMVFGGMDGIITTFAIVAVSLDLRGFFAIDVVLMYYSGCCRRWSLHKCYPCAWI